MNQMTEIFLFRDTLQREREDGAQERTEYYLSLCQLQSTQNSHFILNLNSALDYQWNFN